MVIEAPVLAMMFPDALIVTALFELFWVMVPPRVTSPPLAVMLSGAPVVVTAALVVKLVPAVRLVAAGNVVAAEMVTAPVGVVKTGDRKVLPGPKLTVFEP